MGAQPRNGHRSGSHTHAAGMAMTIIALGVVFGGFLVERRPHDRLEDLNRA